MDNVLCSWARHLTLTVPLCQILFLAVGKTSKLLQSNSGSDRDLARKQTLQRVTSNLPAD